MEQVQTVVEVFFRWWPGVVTVASAIATVTPTPVDNVALRVVRQVVDVLALNVGKAKPAGGKQ